MELMLKEISPQPGQVRAGLVTGFNPPARFRVLPTRPPAGFDQNCHDVFLKITLNQNSAPVSNNRSNETGFNPVSPGVNG